MCSFKNKVFYSLFNYKLTHQTLKVSKTYKCTYFFMWDFSQIHLKLFVFWLRSPTLNLTEIKSKNNKIKGALRIRKDY